MGEERKREGYFLLRGKNEERARRYGHVDWRGKLATSVLRTRINLHRTVINQTGETGPPPRSPDENTAGYRLCSFSSSKSRCCRENVTANFRLFDLTRPYILGREGISNMIPRKMPRGPYKNYCFANSVAFYTIESKLSDSVVLLETVMAFSGFWTCVYLFPSIIMIEASHVFFHLSELEVEKFLFEGCGMFSLLEWKKKLPTSKWSISRHHQTSTQNFQFLVGF